MPNAAPIYSERSFMKKEAVVPYLLVLPALLVLTSTVFLPIIFNVYISFFDFHLIRDATPEHYVGLQNYFELAQDRRFWNAIRITSAFTIISVAIEFVLGLLLALLVNEALPARRLIRTILLAPILTTPLVVALVFRLMWHGEFGILQFFFDSIGLEGTYWLSQPLPAFVAILVTEIWQHTSFVFLLMLGALQMIPKKPLEAAEIDGANYWQRVWYITIPMMRPAIMVAVLFRLVFNLRLFEQVYVLTEGGPGTSTETISVLIYRSAFQQFKMGEAAAMSVYLTLLTVMLSVVLFRVVYRKEQKR